MKRKLALCLFMGLFSIGIFGCDSGEPSNMMENVDLSELEEYERLIEADNAAMAESDDAATDE